MNEQIRKAVMGELAAIGGEEEALCALADRITEAVERTWSRAAEIPRGQVDREVVDEMLRASGDRQPLAHPDRMHALPEEFAGDVQGLGELRLRNVRGSTVRMLLVGPSDHLGYVPVRVETDLFEWVQ